MSGRVVTADWLADHLADVRVVDVREAWAYEALGHVPGAVNVPFEAIRAGEHAAESGEGTGMLPGEAVVADLLGDAGVERADDVVAYDDHHGVFAARFLVTLELYGHPPSRLHLLDGDFSAWQGDHRVETDPVTVDPSTYRVELPADTPLVDADTVAAALEDPEAVVVDTREAEEFAAGHLPGAVRLDWRELVDDETRGLHPEDDLVAILESRGITRDRRVLLYCNTARRISHTYVVLRHLGFERVGFYEGSLTEWAAQDRPIETA